jgi:signal transduction histidine kinase
MDINTIFNITSFAAMVAVVCLIIVLINKRDKIKQLQSSLRKLERAFGELDEQAKLIVKTDLELNKTQEELDKKVTGLYTLQKISQLISTSLDEEEIFNRIKTSLISELGFEKGFILIFDKNKNFSWKMRLSYADKELNKFRDFIKTDEVFHKVLKEGKPVSSSGLPEIKKDRVCQNFEVAYFIICPILTQDGIIGLIFAGNKSQGTPLTEGDEELIYVFATQLGQSVENARLFEEVYKSHQELELKVRERTKELADALEEVKRISKLKSDFVSAVSHELRTPLTSIKGYASIIMSGTMGQIPAAVEERLSKINKHSDNLVKLINDLLDISRIESGRVTMKISPLNLNELILNIADMLAPQIKDKHVDLSVQVQQKLPMVLADSSQIERVFINLLGNAIKFTPQNGTITISAKDADEFVEISVADSGYGIAPKDIEHIFEEFYRVDNPINEKVKGTGLGLPLVKHIIEAHKGKIWVTSKLNEGSTFSFTLPKQKE